MRVMQNDHMKAKPDISYNFVIGGDGTIFEGIGWGKEGFFAKDGNVEDDQLFQNKFLSL